MSQRICISLPDNQANFLKVNKKYSASGILQQAIDRIMQEEDSN